MEEQRWGESNWESTELVVGQGKARGKEHVVVIGQKC